jgi:hypothetical protein
MSVQEDEFLGKAVTTYAEVLQTVKSFQERIEKAGKEALEAELTTIQRAFDTKKDKIKATSVYDAEGPFTEIGLGDNQFYVAIGLWWSLDQHEDRPQTYASVYCKEKAFADALAERCTDDNFESELWGREWYVSSYRAVTIKDVKSLGDAFLGAARELNTIGKRFREEQQRGKR